MTDLTLTCRRTINASPERVYNAWLDPRMMTRFMAGAEDMHVAEARSDARVGGRFFVLMMADKPVPHEGTYKALTPFSRIVFTWESPYAPPESEVELQFAPVDGGTEVVLTQTRFLTESNRDGHSKGWTMILGRLDAALATADA